MMRFVRVLLALTPPLVLAALTAAVWWKLSRPADPYLARVREVDAWIRDRYYGDVSRDKLYGRAIHGMLSALDPHCEYFTPEEWKEFNEMNLEGKFGGVGILVQLDTADGHVVVVTPLEDTPAFEADVLPGDKIVEVDGQSIKGLPIRETVKRIKGEAGTTVRLKIIRKGREPFDVALTRAIIELRTVKSKMVDPTTGIGYIRITEFDKMIQRFDEAMANLQSQGLKALVIDLRFNGGGLLEQCVKLADRFLQDGLIVSTRGRHSEDTEEYRATPEDTLPPMPLAVLVNEGSASASEIFAAALKDRGRAVIVGARTFGKGSVQKPFELSDGSRVKLTIARHYSPSGRSVQREENSTSWGVDPDAVVEMTPQEYADLIKVWNAENVAKSPKPKEVPKNFLDKPLEKALEILRAKLK